MRTLLVGLAMLTTSAAFAQTDESYQLQRSAPDAILD
jgi:hypothetical protein